MRRGEIYYINLGETVGSEINKTRPCIIIQNDVGNRFSNTTIVLPISTKAKRSLPTHIEISEELLEEGLEEITGYVKSEQIRTVDKERIGNLVGALTPEAMEMVNKLILIALGM